MIYLLICDDDESKSNPRLCPQGAALFCRHGLLSWLTTWWIVPRATEKALPKSVITDLSPVSSTAPCVATSIPKENTTPGLRYPSPLLRWRPHLHTGKNFVMKIRFFQSMDSIASFHELRSLLNQEEWEIQSRKKDLFTIRSPRPSLKRKKTIVFLSMWIFFAGAL